MNKILGVCILCLATLTVGFVDGGRRGSAHPPPSVPPGNEDDHSTPPSPQEEFVDLNPLIGDLWWSPQGRNYDGYCPYIRWNSYYSLTELLMWPVTAPVDYGFNVPPGHSGIDQFVSEGTPVIAAAKGQVVWAGGGDSIRGLVVILSHNDHMTAYAHLSQILVVCGQEVSAGQLVGLVGSTGTPKAHLHFTVIDERGYAVDPLSYLPQ